jgi:carbamoyl-phosphate synthase large subunit
MNVLMTAGSRRVALLEAFQAAVRAEGGGRVVVTDIDPSSPSVHVADRAYRVPISSDPEYVETLLAICASERIALVIPTIDDELELLAAARERFTALGAMLACSPVETAALCNDKYQTCIHLAANGIDAARSWLPENLPADAAESLFIKPRVGRGSVGAFFIRNRSELDFFKGYVTNPVIQEFLQSPEYTIDVLCNWKGTPLSIVPRERTLIRAGVSDRGRTVQMPALESLALRITSAIRFYGALNVQCRMRGDTPVVIEINPRFSGGIGLTIAAGAHFPTMLVRLAQGRVVEPAIGNYRADLWMTSFERSLFVPAARLQLPAVTDASNTFSGAA